MKKIVNKTIKKKLSVLRLKKKKIAKALMIKRNEATIIKKHLRPSGQVSAGLAPLPIEEAVEKTVANLPEPPRVLPVVLGQHEPSAHVMRLPALFEGGPVKATTLSYSDIAHQSRWAFWMNELSILSFFGLVFFIVAFFAKHVFRVPILEIHELVKDVVPVRVRRNNQVEVKAPLAFSAPAAVKFDTYAPTSIFIGGLSASVMTVAITGIMILVTIRIVADVARLQTVRAEVVGTASAGLASFAEGGEAIINYDFFKAASEFEASLNHFREAAKALEDIPPILRILAKAAPPGELLDSGESLIRAGAALSRVGQKVSANYAFLNHGGEPAAELSAAKLLADLSRTAGEIKPDLDEAVEEISNVRAESLPPEYRPVLENVQTFLPLIKSGINQLMTISDIAPDLMGLRDKRHYLVVFQNNHELRASGGFMGSFAMVDMKDGKIESIKVPSGGTYDLQGSLIPRLLAPAPLQLINPRWEFQDSNWWSDWPTSARKIAWFYRQAGGESVDGVVAVDINVIESLLEITGPIPMPAYNLTVTADNFAAETQAEVEIRYDRAVNRPKQFIADLAPLLVGRLEAGLDHNGLKLAEALSRGLTEKHLLIYRDEVNIEQRLKDLGWAGALPNLSPQTDIVGIVHTNIAGGKTDGVISNNVEHNAIRQTDGALTDTLIITRTHAGQKGELFTGARNVDYLRVYVPSGSRLVSASGFQEPERKLFNIPASDLVMDEDLRGSSENIRPDPNSGVSSYEELGRTVFAGWLMVDPGASATVTLSYELPWRANKQSSSAWLPWSSYFGWSPDTQAYRLSWEKQPGLSSTMFKHSFKSNVPINIRDTNASLASNEHGWTWERELNSDAILQVTYLNQD